MTQQINEELFKKSIFVLLKETFDKGDGIYLDQGTSLEETLALLSAAEASRPIRESGTSIASHVYHLLFYVRILNDYMDGKWHEKVDWPGSWARKIVSENEWDALRKQLKNDYDALLKHLESFTDWNDERRLGGALGILAHSAYHLGAIRQILRVIKK